MACSAAAPIALPSQDPAPLTPEGRAEPTLLMLIPCGHTVHIRRLQKSGVFSRQKCPDCEARVNKTFHNVALERLLRILEVDFERDFHLDRLDPSLKERMTAVASVALSERPPAVASAPVLPKSPDATASAAASKFVGTYAVLPLHTKVRHIDTSQFPRNVLTDATYECKAEPTAPAFIFTTRTQRVAIIGFQFRQSPTCLLIDVRHGSGDSVDSYFKHCEFKYTVAKRREEYDRPNSQYMTSDTYFLECTRGIQIVFDHFARNFAIKEPTYSVVRELISKLPPD